ncbi:MAG: signal peptidase I [Candidatus Sungbacteria bacterium]|nr:signal peptidase I [Candidatus Sungbacteria bacterium]
MAKIKQLGTYGYYIFTAALAAIALIIVISAFPIPGMYQFRVVSSGSMEPAIKTGSVVLIKSASSYEIGDVLTFNGNFKNAKGQKVPTTHRIVEMRVERGNPIYITKGDANEEQDTREVLQNQVIGKVYLSIPYLGYAIETARTTYGFLALIIIPALIIVWDQTQKIWEEIKKAKKNKTLEIASE